MGPDRRASDSHRVDFPSAIASSFRSDSTLAERVLARDIADEEHDAAAAAAVTDDDAGEEEGEGDAGRRHPRAANRRTSGVASGGARPILNPQSSLGEPEPLGADEEEEMKRSRHSRAAETSPLLGDADAHVGRRAAAPEEGEGGAGGVSASRAGDEEQPWTFDEEARTTWRRETKTIATYSGPLIVTFFLQYSINVASIFAVGRIGRTELQAVSVANMTAAIICLAPFEGLATSLDTLCAQAYGSGHKHLVGLQFQRMTCFLFTLMLPASVLYWFSEKALLYIIPEKEAAHLAALYLRVMIFSIPGLILFECGKRFTQAQGLFRATTYVLLVASPVNVLLLWVLVWRLDMGFIGAPICVAITHTLLPLLLWLYVRFVDGSQCWGGLSRRALSNWWVMVRLALPGMIMVEAEWLAFEVMTLLASRFGPTQLAAHGVLITLGGLSYQIPFSMSIAASTRVANLIGAGFVGAARTAAKVTVVVSLVIGLFNLAIYSALRFQLPLLFTNDAEVVALAAKVIPILALTQVFDSLSAGAHALLRGIGRQAIGGPSNLFSHYVVALPVSLGLAFGLGWELDGLWLGATVGLVTVSLIEYVYLVSIDWSKAAIEAEIRNAAG